MSTHTICLTRNFLRVHSAKLSTSRFSSHRCETKAYSSCLSNEISKCRPQTLLLPFQSIRRFFSTDVDTSSTLLRHTSSQLPSPLSASPLEASHSFIPSSTHLSLEVTDQEVIQFLSQYPTPPSLSTPGLPLQSEMALTALRIGVLSLRQAASQFDSHSVQREVDRMVELLGHQLLSHERLVQSQLSATLQEYFDPSQGRFQERIRRLVDEDGELVSVLREQIVGEDSRLYRQMEGLLGAHSPLLLSLSPDSKQGISTQISHAVHSQLSASRKEIYELLSPDSARSPLYTLVRQMRQTNEGLTASVTKALGDMQGEFSLANSASTLSQLIAGMDGVHKKIASEFSLDIQNSALARLRSEIFVITSQQTEAIKGLEQLVIRELSALSAQKKTEETLSLRTPLHGIHFETALASYLSTISPHDTLVEVVGNHTGLIRNCKVGDILITLGPEHVACGARIVVEAKADKNYTLPKALVELETARKNRDAEVGVFILSSTTSSFSEAPLEPVSRHGNDVFCFWDQNDPATDVYLRAAISLAKALCVRSHSQYPLSRTSSSSSSVSPNLGINSIVDEVDGDGEFARKNERFALFLAEREEERRREREKEHIKALKTFTAMDKAILDIEKQASGLEDVRKLTETIIASADKILHKVRLARSRLESAAANLEDLSRQAKETKQNRDERDMQYEEEMATKRTEHLDWILINRMKNL